MLLKHTDALLKEKLQKKAFDTYTVLVGVGDEEKLLSSSNADGDTLYDIASCGKVLHTATLILKAVGEGKLSLDSTLPEFFPNVPEDKKGVTIRHLLTHTSGIIRTNLPKDVCAQGKDAIAAFILKEPVVFQPGEDYIYSCHGFILMGFILEKLYGGLLKDIFDEKLRKPLGMTRSRFEIGLDEENAAVNWVRKEVGPLRFGDNNNLAMGFVGGSGGSFFTARDIQKFVKAVMAKSDLLYPEYLYDLAEKNYTPKFQRGRGLGWTYVTDKYLDTGHLFPDGSIGHDGWTGQCFYLNREKKLYAIILTNATRHFAIRCDYRNIEYYDFVKELRYEIHDEIKRDLEEEGLL